MHKVFQEHFPHEDGKYTCAKCGARKTAADLHVLIFSQVDDEHVELGPLCDKCIEERGPSMFSPEVEELLLAKSFESQTSHFG